MIYEGSQVPQVPQVPPVLLLLLLLLLLRPQSAGREATHRAACTGSGCLARRASRHREGGHHQSHDPGGICCLSTGLPGTATRAEPSVQLKSEPSSAFAVPFNPPRAGVHQHWGPTNGALRAERSRRGRTPLPLSGPSGRIVGDLALVLLAPGSRAPVHPLCPRQRFRVGGTDTARPAEAYRNSRRPQADEGAVGP